jgi:hypothetical protein
MAQSPGAGFDGFAPDYSHFSARAGLETIIYTNTSFSDNLGIV